MVVSKGKVEMEGEGREHTLVYTCGSEVNDVSGGVGHGWCFGVDGGAGSDVWGAVRLCLPETVMSSFGGSKCECGSTRGKYREVEFEVLE